MGLFLKRRLGFYRIARIRSVLNRLTRGRIGLYSTAEHYSSGPYAKVLRYYQYDRNRKLRCSVCGWRGTGRSASRNMFDELFDVRCPDCDEMLVVVGYPTLDETRAAAAAGNLRAQERLQSVNTREAFLDRAEALKLKEADQLPELDGSSLQIDWDFEERDGQDWTVLRHDGEEIWRELAFWEGHERFGEVFELLRQRYGQRLAEVRPTPASELYLYGDTLSAPGRIDALNASLGDS